jgi:dGTPase
MSSIGKPEICQSSEMREAMFGLRRFMFEHVYSNEVVKGEEKKAQEMLRILFDYYLKNWETLPNEYIELCMQENEAHEIIVSDYIAGMTDFYATKRFEELFVPNGWKK